MKHLSFALAAILLAVAPAAPALAAAGNFTLVNRTGANIVSLQIRRVGTSQWRALGGTPANGGRVSITFSDPDCAFDLQATLAGGRAVTYEGINLCDVNAVTLNLNAGGDHWVDYD